MKIYLLMGLNFNNTVVLGAYEDKEVADSTIEACEKFKYTSSLISRPFLPENFRDFEDFRVDSTELVN